MGKIVRFEISVVLFLCTWGAGARAWSKYVMIRKSEVPVYASVQEAIRRASPVRLIKGPRINLSLEEIDVKTQEDLDKEGLLLINPGEYVFRSDVEMIPVSSFAGIQCTNRTPKKFGWTLDPARPQSVPGSVSAPDKVRPELPMNTFVELGKVQRVGKQNWTEIKGQGWVPETSIRYFYPVKRPRQMGPTEKWIHVRISQQTLAAYEGDRLVFATLMSSGRPSKETKRGLFRIYNRLEKSKMAGDDGDPEYFLFEDIPYHLYFYKHQAIHGAYSRQRFGRKGSHGCINLSLADAKWLWEWTGGSQNAGRLGPDQDAPISGERVWIRD